MVSTNKRINNHVVSCLFLNGTLIHELVFGRSAGAKSAGVNGQLPRIVPALDCSRICPRRTKKIRNCRFTSHAKTRSELGESPSSPNYCAGLCVQKQMPIGLFMCLFFVRRESETTITPRGIISLALIAPAVVLAHESSSSSGAIVVEQQLFYCDHFIHHCLYNISHSTMSALDPCVAINGAGLAYREFSCDYPQLEPLYFE